MVNSRFSCTDSHFMCIHFGHAYSTGAPYKPTLKIIRTSEYKITLSISVPSNFSQTNVSLLFRKNYHVDNFELSWATVHALALTRSFSIDLLTQKCHKVYEFSSFYAAHSTPRNASRSNMLLYIARRRPDTRGNVDCQ
jgi:hypothetical protein